MIKRSWDFPTKHPVINPDHLAGQKGDRSPKRLFIVQQLIAVMIGDFLHEGLRIFDYGCGLGWLANMLSGKLEKFTYWGMEPSTSAHQTQRVIEANRSLGSDPRVTFGHLGGELEREALENVDVVYLGSIFTHLDWQNFSTIMMKFKPVINRGGLVVFDCFLGEKEKLTGPGSYGCPDCYHTSFYIEEKLEEFCRHLGWELEKVMGIMAHGGHFHYNFRVTRRGNGEISQEANNS